MVKQLKLESRSPLFTPRDPGRRLGGLILVPLTGAGVVKTIFTDVAVISVEPEGLLLQEVAPGWSPEDVQQITDAPLRISPQLREITL